MGCAEMSLCHIIGIIMQMGSSHNVEMFRSGDKSHLCRNVLLHHEGIGRPEHVTGCILERSDTRAVEAMQSALANAHQEVRKLQRRGGG